MKKLLTLFALTLIIGASAQNNGQPTRFINYPKVTYLSDTDYIMVSKSDSAKIKIAQLKYLKSYQTAIKDTTPGTGHTVVLTNGYSTLAIHATGTISSCTIILPTAAINGQTFTITSDQAISTLTLTGTTVTSYTSLAIASPIKLIYDVSLTKWFNR